MRDFVFALTALTLPLAFLLPDAPLDFKSLLASLRGYVVLWGDALDELVRVPDSGADDCEPSTATV